LTCEKENIKRMSEVWHVLKKSLHCRSHSSEVHDPQAKRRDQRNKRESKNQVSHEIFLDRSSGEIKICTCYPIEEPLSHSPRKTKVSIVSSKTPSRCPAKTKLVSSKTHCVDCDECVVFSKKKVPVKDFNNPPVSTRHRGFEDKMKSCDTVEEHQNHLHSGKIDNFSSKMNQYMECFICI